MDYLAMGSDNDVVVANALKLLKIQLKGKGYREDDLQLHSLKSVVQLKNNTPNYILDFAKSSGKIVLPVERYLDETDAHAFTLIRLSFAKAIIDDKTARLSAAKWSSFIDLSVFTDPVGTNILTEAQQLCQFFNTDLSIETKDDSVIKEYPTNLLMYAPVSNSLATAVNATGAAGELEGFQTLCKRPMWVGGKRNQVKINLNDDALTSNLEGAGDTKNFMQVELLGFKINNGGDMDVTTTIIDDITDCGSKNYGLV